MYWHQPDDDDETIIFKWNENHFAIYNFSVFREMQCVWPLSIYIWYNRTECIWKHKHMHILSWKKWAWNRRKSKNGKKYKCYNSQYSEIFKLFKKKTKKKKRRKWKRVIKWFHLKIADIHGSYCILYACHMNRVDM